MRVAWTVCFARVLIGPFLNALHSLTSPCAEPKHCRFAAEAARQVRYFNFGFQNKKVLAFTLSWLPRILVLLVQVYILGFCFECFVAFGVFSVGNLK